MCSRHGTCAGDEGMRLCATPPTLQTQLQGRFGTTVRLHVVVCNLHLMLYIPNDLCYTINILLFVCATRAPCTVVSHRLQVFHHCTRSNSDTRSAILQIQTSHNIRGKSVERNPVKMYVAHRLRTSIAIACLSHH